MAPTGAEKYQARIRYAVRGLWSGAIDRGQFESNMTVIVNDKDEVFIADRVGSGPFDPELFAAVGRPFEPGPDFIFTVNLLYQLGIHPKIDYIEIDQSRTFASREDAVESCRWMLDELTPAEEAGLAAYVDERLEQSEGGTYTLRRSSRVK